MMSNSPASAPNNPSDVSARVDAACPNFLYLGPAKSGSTWTYNLLDQHPEVYMAPGKALYYFSTQYFRGEPWYLSFFQDGVDQKIRGEVAHNYLPTAIESSRRIYEMNSQMRLMVCLREPCSRTFSAYLDGVKNGRYPEGTSFEEALETDSTLIDQSRYATHLKPFLELFPRAQLHVALFDDLQEDPQQFADRLCDFLDIARLPLDEKTASKMMPAGKPRFRWLVRMAKSSSKLALKLGLRGLRGKVKTSRRIRNLLYVPYSSDRAPKLTEQQRRRLQEVFCDEIHELDQLCGLGLAQRWDYAAE